MKSKILVTGAAGFIGFHLVNKFLSMGYEVVGLDNINDYYDVNLKYARLANLGIFSPNETSYDCHTYRDYKEIDFGLKLQANNSSSFTFIRIDLKDKDSLFRLVEEEGVNCIVHLAAQAGVRYSLENPHGYIDANVYGFLNILEVCRHKSIHNLVYASSSSVYGNNTKVPFEEEDTVDMPASLYAATKRSNELMAYTYNHLFGIKTIGLRFFTVYGPWGRPDMSPMLFASAIKEKRSIKIFNNGIMKRDFTYIDDIVDGIVGITINYSQSNGSSVFNIGNGSPVDLMNFISTLEKELGIASIQEMLPMQPGDVKQTWANTNKLKNAIGYDPKVNIELGIHNFVQWFDSFFVSSDKTC